MPLTKTKIDQVTNSPVKSPCRAVTVSNVVLSGGAPLVVDTVTLLQGCRVLVTGQTNPAENGIYSVVIPGTGANGVWTRSRDADMNGELFGGIYVTVTEGRRYRDTTWLVVTNEIDIGVTPVAIRLVRDEKRRNFIVVQSDEDLPLPSGGVHELEDDTYYQFNGTVTSSNSIRFGNNTMIGGLHFGVDRFVYTGTGTALTGTNANVYIDTLSVSAPSGTAINVSGTTATELLANYVEFNNCNSLGTITGFRRPSLMTCTFDTFNTGLTFAGTSTKIFVSACPFRNAAANSTCVTIGATVNTPIIDIVDNYFGRTTPGNVTGVSLVTGATVSTYGIFRGNTFEFITTPTTGFDSTTPGWGFVNNSGIADSTTVGEYFMDDNATATTLTVNTWTKVAGATTAGILERTSMPQNNRLQILSIQGQIKLQATAALSILGTSNNQVVEVAIYKNGVIASAPLRLVLVGTTRADSATLIALEQLQANDFLEVWIRCTSGNNNATVQRLNFILS
jgi:hypothetical protein